VLVNAKVVLARCFKTKKSFGIRVEQRGSQWFSTWAFPIDEQKAKREGIKSDSADTPLTGHDVGYPGCPHCGSIDYCQCSCKKIGCYDGVFKKGAYSKEYNCPWCGNKFIPVPVDHLDVTGDGY
jgi:hypothetical protein